MTSSAHRWAATPAIGLLLGVAVWIIPAGPAQAAGIAWEKQGAFQACLDGKAKAWISAKVELVLNEDPDMGAINDTAVAQWAARALKDCAGAEGADAASEVQFMKYIAHWREHIDAAANKLRSRTRPD